MAAMCNLSDKFLKLDDILSISAFEYSDKQQDDDDLSFIFCKVKLLS